jgi:RNA polymerase sigma-70 factor (ECF subfamily)
LQQEFAMKVYVKLTDVELVALLKEGDQLAYTEIFERYSDLLLRHAFRILADQDEVNDVVQDVFMVLWQKRADLRFRTSLSAFLYVATRNRIFDHLSHQKVVLRYASSISKFMVEGYAITDDQVREKELSVIIEREINCLPEKMRAVFLLNKKEGLSYQQIGVQLHISDQTAKQQVYKALKILKGKMDSFISVYSFL